MSTTSPDGSGIQTGDLRAQYLLATDRFVLGQVYALLLRQQPSIGLSSVGAGAALEAADLQRQLNSQARYYSNRVMPSFLHLFTLSSNNAALIKAAIEVLPPEIRKASENEMAREASAQAMTEIARQTSRLHDEAREFAKVLVVIDELLLPLQGRLGLALAEAVSRLEDSAAEALQRIDELKAEIRQNISDIVAGAEEVGDAANELGIGTITAIERASAGSAGAEGNGDAADGKGGDAATAPSGSDGETAASADFVVKSIKGARSGAAKTSQARADLNANNERLAVAIQELARDDALIASAQVIAVQGDMFAGAVADARASIEQLGMRWGSPPSGLRSGTGLALAFADFSRGIQSVSAEPDALELASRFEASRPAWQRFGEELAALKESIINMRDLPST